MTPEQQDLLRNSEAILAGLSDAIDGAEPRATLFALTTFVIATIKQTGTPLDEFIVALRRAQEIGEEYVEASRRDRS